MEPRHSGLGIASFITSLVVGAGLFVLIVLAGVMEASKSGGIDEASPLAVGLGLLIIGGVFLQFLALVLGLAGLLQRNRAKVFAVLGVIFSSTAIAGIVGLMVVGMSM